MVPSQTAPGCGNWSLVPGPWSPVPVPVRSSLQQRQAHLDHFAATTYAELHRTSTDARLQRPLVGGRDGGLSRLGHRDAREPLGLGFISDFTSLSHPSCQSLIVKSFTHAHTGCSLSLSLPVSLSPSLSLSLSLSSNTYGVVVRKRSSISLFRLAVSG